MKKQLKAILNKIPFFNRLIQQRYIKRKFNVELALLNKNHINKSLKTSVIHFSINKSATQYIKSILRKTATANGMTAVGMNDYAFHSTMPFLNRLSNKELGNYQHIFKPKGYVYTVFGAMVGIKKLDSYKVILVVRDPRDVLVSGYFSKVFSHPLPPSRSNKRGKFEGSRQAAQNRTIDEYILKNTEKIYDIYTNYIYHLLEKNTHVYVCKYEEMINDFEGWLTGLCDYAELELTAELKQQFIAKHQAKIPKKENPKKHLRKGIQGDYKTKLNPETIDNLNIKFKEILNYFVYNE